MPTARLSPKQALSPENCVLLAHGKPVDATQEMIALGLSNLLGSFVQSMPVTGSFSRTAVNAASGVRTTFGGVYTGSLVLLALAFLMKYCAYIPIATLSAVIITAVIFSVEYEVVRPMWKSKSRGEGVFAVWRKKKEVTNFISFL